MKPVAFILSLLVFSSCCNSKLINTIKFTEAELEVNPYSGTEDLKFIDNNGNVIIYDSRGRATSQKEEPVCDGGCCDYYFVESSDNTSFASEYKKSNIQVVISNNFDQYSGVKGTPTLHFAWDYYEIKPYVTGTGFGGLPVDSMQEKGIEQGVFRDTIILRNSTYYNIYTFPGYCPYPDRLQGDTLYYSKTEGIIGLKFSDGNLWVKQE